MTRAVLSQLVAATKATATHPLAEYRFWSCVGLLSDLSIQNDDHGVIIAAEQAIDFLQDGHPNEQEVEFVRDTAGSVVDIDVSTSFPANDLVALARSVALLTFADHRAIVLEVACLALIQNKDWDGRELLNAVTALSHGGRPGILEPSVAPHDSMALTVPASATQH